MRKEIVRINLIESINENELRITARTAIPDVLSGTMDFLKINDNEFFGIYDDRFSKLLDEKRGGYYLNTKTGDFQSFSLLNLKIHPNEIMPATNINARMPVISPIVRMLQ